MLQRTILLTLDTVRVSLDTALAVGDSITLVWLNTNGATPYYPNVINIDGSAVTPKVPAAISSW
jgi:hypothetical protein